MPAQRTCGRLHGDGKAFGCSDAPNMAGTGNAPPPPTPAAAAAEPRPLAAGRLTPTLVAACPIARAGGSIESCMPRERVRSEPSPPTRPPLTPNAPAGAPHMAPPYMAVGSHAAGSAAAPIQLPAPLQQPPPTKAHEAPAAMQPPQPPPPAPPHTPPPHAPTPPHMPPHMPPALPPHIAIDKSGGGMGPAVDAHGSCDGG